MYLIYGKSFFCSQNIQVLRFQSDMSLDNGLINRFFCLDFFFLKKKVLLCFLKNNLKWIGGEERDSSDFKMQINNVEKPFFVQFHLAVSPVAIIKNAAKKVVNCQYLRISESP